MNGADDVDDEDGLGVEMLASDQSKYGMVNPVSEGANILLALCIENG